MSAHRPFQLELDLDFDSQGVRALVMSLVEGLRGCWQRSEQRRALRELDNDERRDIGITLQQAEQEADKPFWR